ncbi:PQQ-binding-like beta-propeller repeat protein [Paenibacillus sp. GCM10023250]|uniref:outer membrane protein assembly factor BamB family protein n=1 Tax=Paenibacillus sp. GCM10023250 TaxID=3252648 RepID=UPI003613EC64
MNMRMWKSAALGLLAAGTLLSSLGAAGAASAQASGAPSYSLDTPYSFENLVPAAKPLWSAELDRPSATDRALYPPAVGGGSLYYVKDGALLARSASTGRTLWSFGAKLQPGSAVVAGSFVYAGGTDGSVYRVNPATGKGARIYRAKENAPVSLTPDGTMLYASAGGRMTAIDLATGKAKWTAAASGQGAPIVLADKLLFGTWESGAITVNVFYAVDKATGKTLWRLEGSHNALLKADGNQLYFSDDWPRNDTSAYVAAIDVVDGRTGKITGSLSFVPVKAGTDPLVQAPRHVGIDGDDVYVTTFDNETYRCSLTADPSIARPEPIAAGAEFAAGPYNGKLFFKGFGGMGVDGRKLFDRTQVYYQGLDNPASRIDFAGTGMFVGQTDGELYALNVATGKALFRYRTDARAYGPFQVSGGVLLAQAEDRLYAFRLPAELLRPAGPGTDGAFAKADAVLSVDGQKRPVTSSMMTLGNRMFVPVRFLTETLGAKAAYDAAAKRTTIVYGERSFVLAAGLAYAVAGGKQTPLTFAPATLNGTLYVPVADAGRLLGIGISWDGGSRTVVVTTKTQAG